MVRYLSRYNKRTGWNDCVCIPRVQHQFHIIPNRFQMEAVLYLLVSGSEHSHFLGAEYHYPDAFLSLSFHLKLPLNGKSKLIIRTWDKDGTCHPVPNNQRDFSRIPSCQKEPVLNDRKTHSITSYSFCRCSITSRRCCTCPVASSTPGQPLCHLLPFGFRIG